MTDYAKKTGPRLATVKTDRNIKLYGENLFFF